MTTSIKAGDYLTVYGMRGEVVSVGGISPAGIMDAVVTHCSLGLVYRRVDLNTTACVQSADDPEVLRDEYSVSLATTLAKIGECKFGTISEVAEVLMANHVDYVWNEVKYKGRHDLEEFIEKHRVSLKGFVPPVGVLRTLFEVFQPIKSELRAGNIALTRTLKDYKADREVSMKPGRAFRFMFPGLNDNDVSLLAEAWIERTQPRTLTVYTGDKAADFAHIYKTDRADYRNPSTTHVRKSLATSCMHNTYRVPYMDGTRVYASEPYASGDFFALWVEDENNLLAGRTVVGITSQGLRHGPLYGACEQSLDTLQSFLDNLDSKADCGDWVGLKMKVIGDRDELVAPYLDGGYSGDIIGDYIVLSDKGRGEFSFEGTDGYPTSSDYCEACCESVHGDDLFRNDDGCGFCEHCFHELYVHLENGDVCPIDDAVEVYRKTEYGVYTKWHYMHDDGIVYCELVGEWWDIDDVTFSKCDEPVPTHLTHEYPELFPVEEKEAA